MKSVKKGVLTGRKAIGIIFLVVGIMLTFFIFGQGTGVYQSSRQSSDERGVSSLQCVGFLYTVDGITADGGEVQFNFRNSIASTEDVHNITVVDSDERRQTFQISIPVGTFSSVRVPVQVIDNFSVYPDNCRVFPTRCSLEGACAYH